MFDVPPLPGVLGYCIICLCLCSCHLILSLFYFCCFRCWIFHFLKFISILVFYCKILYRVQCITYTIGVLRVGGLVGVVLTGYFYRRFLGEWWPYISFRSLEGRGSFPLWGRHYFVFDGYWCVVCGGRPPYRLGMCYDCYFSVDGLRRRIVVEGLSAYDPAYADVLSDVVMREYVIYLGAFGPIYKVGVTALDRFGSPRGFLTRLAEQGFQYAGVVRGGFNLFEALELERDVARVFGVRDSIRFEEKVGVLHEDADLRELRVLVDKPPKGFLR